MIPAFRRENLKYLAFVINRTPEVVRLAIDPDEPLVQVPSPLGNRPMMNASFRDRGGEHRTEPVPPQPYRLVADVYTPLEQNIFYLPKRQWIADHLPSGDRRLLVMRWAAPTTGIAMCEMQLLFMNYLKGSRP